MVGLVHGGSTYSADFQKCPGWESLRFSLGSFSSMSISRLKLGLSCRSKAQQADRISCKKALELVVCGHLGVRHKDRTLPQESREALKCPGHLWTQNPGKLVFQMSHNLPGQNELACFPSSSTCR